MKPYEKLLEFWSQTATGIHGAPADEAEIAELEARFGVRLPEDFRDYLLGAAPGSGEFTDANLTTWWEPSRIASEQTINGQPISFAGDPTNRHKYLAFADYMFWSWGWAIACGDTDQRGAIVVLNDHGRIVASDFATFVDLNINMDTTGDQILA